MTTICTSAAANFSISYVYGGGSVFTGSVTLYDFNVNIGIGNNSSSLDITVLFGGCNNVSDQPTSIPTIGRLVRFICNNFVFTGIVNTAIYSVSENGFLFKIKLTDANKVIENTTVLLKDYYCPLSAPNFINVANLIEGGAAVCPPGSDTENWPRNGNCAVFGTSGVDGNSPNNGISLKKAIQALNGQPIYTTIGEIINLNLGILYNAISSVPYATVNTPDMSLMAVINAACDYLACDFFIMLDGSQARVLLIDRSTPPPLGIIGNIIATAEQSGTLIRSENGFQEVYAESNKVIIGDKVSYLAERTLDDRPDMMLGYDVDGKVVRASGRNFKNVEINTQALKDVIGFPFNMYAISEEEIICAGSHHMWLVYGLKQGNEQTLSYQVSKHLGLNQGDLLNNARKSWEALIAANSFDKWKSAITSMSGVLSGVALQETTIKFKIAYDWFKAFIDTYYGKKWLVPLSGVCAFPKSNTKIIRGDTGEFYLSDVASDSGYPSENQSQEIRGLRTWIETSVFETSDNRISGFVDADMTDTVTMEIVGQQNSFKVNTAEINPSSFVAKNNRLYLKMDAGGSEFHINPSTNEGELLIHLDDMIPMVVDVNNGNLVNTGIRTLAALFNPTIFNEVGPNGKNYTDNSTINILNVNSVAGDFSGIVIPLQSNIYVYGPWTGSSGPIGSTKVDIIGDLNPWNYGGYNNMSTVGQALADAGLRASNLEETGSFSLAEPPGYSIEYFLSASVLIDSITVNYGSSGVTTDYSFKTYGTKFGQYGQALAERMKQVTQLRNKTIEQIRNQRRNTLTMAANLNSAIAKNKLNVIIPNANNGAGAANANKPSPGFVFVGGYWDIQLSTSGSSDPISPAVEYDPTRQEICDLQDKSVQEASDGSGSSKDRLYDAGISTKYFIEGSSAGEKYKGTAIMSMDALFAPVSLSGRDGKLPQYFKSWNTNKCLSKSTPSMPPVMLQGSSGDDCLSINQKYLNPILSQSILSTWDGRQGSTNKGCNIYYLSFADKITKIWDEEVKEQQTDFGFFALKGPLVLQSWGYDTNNKPIPNIVDSPESAEAGYFNPKTKNKFMPNWLKNPASWPVGPIDLRFDRERGVWVAPTQDRIVIARLIEDLPALGSANAVLINPTSDDKTFYEDYPIIGPNGEDIGSDLGAAKIKVYEYHNEELYIDNTVYAYYDGSKYIILEHDGNQPKNKFFQLTEDMSSCNTAMADEVILKSGAPCVEFKEACKGLKDQEIHDISNEIKKYNTYLKKTNIDDPVPSATYLEATRTKIFPESESQSSSEMPIWTVLRFLDCSCAASSSSSSSSSTSSSSSSTSSSSSSEDKTLQVLTNARLESSGLYFDTAIVMVTDIPPAGEIKIDITTCPSGTPPPS